MNTSLIVELVNLGLAATGTLPKLTALYEFLGDLRSLYEKQSNDALLRQFGRELHRLRGRIVDVQHRNEQLERHLSEVVTQALIIARRSHNPVKLEAAARLMANALLRDGDSELIEHAERQLFLNALESLSDAAIVLVVRVHQNLSQQDKSKLQSELVRADFLEQRRALPQLEDSLLMGVVSELDRFNLLQKIGTPTVRTGNYDNYPIHITPLAVRFVRFVQASPQNEA